MRTCCDDRLNPAFIERYCRDLNKKLLTLAASAEQALPDYAWPGNVRELQNCIERAVILADGETIRVGQLSLSFRQAPDVTEDANSWEGIDLSGSLAGITRRVATEVEHRKIEQVLKEANGNRVRAAELLQVSQKVFVTKLKEHGLGP